MDGTIILYVQMVEGSFESKIRSMSVSFTSAVFDSSSILKFVRVAQKVVTSDWSTRRGCSAEQVGNVVVQEILSGCLAFKCE